MIKLYLIRHGRQNSPLCNVDVPLDEAGKRQAELVAKRLKNYDIEALYYAIKDPIVIEDAAAGDVYMITAHVIDNHGRRIESTGHNGYYKIVEKESFLGIEMLTDE